MLPTSVIDCSVVTSSFFAFVNGSIKGAKFPLEL